MDTDSQDVETIRTRACELPGTAGDDGRLEKLLEIAQAALREIGRIRNQQPRRIGFAPPCRIQGQRHEGDR